MDEPLPVHERQRPANVTGNGQGALDIGRPVFQQRRNGATGHVLLDEVRVAALFADVVDGDEVRMRP